MALKRHTDEISVQVKNKAFRRFSFYMVPLRKLPYFCRVGWKFGYKKVTFAEKQFESFAYIFELKNTSKLLWVEYPSGMGSRALPHIPRWYNSP